MKVIKSNLTRKDYDNLISNSKIDEPSRTTIIVDNIKGLIFCCKIKIHEGYINIDGAYKPPLYKNSFKIFFKNINIEDFIKLVRNQEIKIDNIKYYLAKHSISFEENEIVFISYDLYTKEKFDGSNIN